MARKPTLAVQKKVMTRKRLIITAVFTGAIVLFVLFSSHGLLSRWRISSDHESLERQVISLKHTEDSLRALIKNLETDTLEIERLARERYGYIRPGERVFRIKRTTE
jgi:cell division protein FtsB